MAFLSIAQPLAICQPIFIIVFFYFNFFEKSIAYFKIKAHSVFNERVKEKPP